MEDDDEFGDLYSDVLQPPHTSPAPPPPPAQSPPLDFNGGIPSNDEEILFGSNCLKSGQTVHNLSLNLNKKDDFAVKSERIVSMDVDSGARVLKTLEVGKTENREIKEENYGIEEFMIPGLSASGGTVLGAGGEEWDDSDSEDDLQIVLNDESGMGMDGLNALNGLNGLNEEDEDEDGDDLVIVTGDVDAGHLHNQPMEEMKEWGQDGGQAGEGNELLGGDAGKVEGGGAGGPKTMGFGGHGYHSFHSQFKYVRPGAAPLPGAGPVAVGGTPGQVRPPGGLLPFAGRGRGEWRPGGIKNLPPNMQNNFHPGHGTPGWGNNGAGRGLDFTLPSHKTIFEVDIDGFEEKPWRLQGIDMSDFFNFDMNEESWKEYCKQLEQHRLEATMQSKIRVYESGRTEREYDPDLPPELAAAAGHDISFENRNIEKIDLQGDLSKGSARSRMQLPTGKAIQVETGFGERLPSIDTRPPRIRDSDAIIEIVLQRSPSPSPSPDRESVQGDDVVEHLEDNPSKESKKEGLGIEDEVGPENDRFNKPETPHKEESTESVDRKQSPSSSRLTLGSAENQSFDQDDDVEEVDIVTDGNTNDDNTLKDERSKHKMRKQKLITRAEPVNETRGRDMKGMDDQYSHRKWESSHGYRSHPKYENYDTRRSKESEGVWLDDTMKRSHKARENEHRSRKVMENGGWKDDGLKTQTRHHTHHTVPEGEPYRESSSRRKRERDDNMQREKDKSWVGHSRMKEDSRSSNKDYSLKETGREHASRRDKFENETVSRHRGREDAYLHGNKISNEERIPSRHERGYSGGTRDAHGVQDKKYKETSKKGKETDGTIQNSSSTSRRNREDNSSHRSEQASSRSTIEQRASDQNPVTRKSSKKHKEKETATSEDDQQESRKGRSKLERWSSHKDTDFGLDIKETDIKHKGSKDSALATRLPEESIKPQENLEQSKQLVEEKNDDKHLDTVEKLKKRSERFKLPMPSEKEALAIKKMENEPLVSSQPETRPESEVKPERPARKRRWTNG